MLTNQTSVLAAVLFLETEGILEPGFSSINYI